MNYTREERRVFENLCQKIIERPRPMDEQPHCSRDGKMFCDDWRIIEILKYFFNGEEMYLGDPPPNRLKNNPLWSKEIIIGQAQQLLSDHQTPEAIVEYLQTQRNKPYERSGAL